MKPGDLVSVDYENGVEVVRIWKTLPINADRSTPMYVKPGAVGLVVQPESDSSGIQGELSLPYDLCLFGDTYGYVSRAWLKKVRL